MHPQDFPVLRMLKVDFGGHRMQQLIVVLIYECNSKLGHLVPLSVLHASKICCSLRNDTMREQRSLHVNEVALATNPWSFIAIGWMDPKPHLYIYASKYASCILEHMPTFLCNKHELCANEAKKVYITVRLHSNTLHR